MIQTLKQIKNRIRSTENTQKVTGAMEMVSVAKLNRIGKTLYSLKPYALSLKEMMDHLTASQSRIDHSFFRVSNKEDKICLCLITSDSGLCGPYNNNIIRCAEEFIEEHGRDKVSLVCIGRKGYNYFKKYNLEILNSYIGMNGRYSDKTSSEISGYLIDIFTSAKAAAVYIAYTHSYTALIHKPMINKFLNLERSNLPKVDYILEPGINDILDEIIPQYIAMNFKMIILDAFNAEHSARTLAMKTATDNAKELLRGLVLLRNKVRQANITQEIMEIISSSEALKG
jgi:F-type H+-transporting ATPase subunit gamma